MGLFNASLRVLIQAGTKKMPGSNNAFFFWGGGFGGGVAPVC